MIKVSQKISKQSLISEIAKENMLLSIVIHNSDLRAQHNSVLRNEICSENKLSLKNFAATARYTLTVFDYRQLRTRNSSNVNYKCLIAIRQLGYML